MKAPEVLLCDADGNLFASEDPAFEASAGVTNAFLEAHGIDRSFTASELRRWARGRNFRSVASELAGEVDDLEHWVQEERRRVTAHLAGVLRPDPQVHEPLGRLGRRCRLVAVSSSALARLAACFTAAGLDELIPPAARYSAEDSLPEPASKPDPAVYLHTLRALGIEADRALAVEDAVAGVRSAVGAGIRVVGNLQFVAPCERRRHALELLRAGATTIVESWGELETLLDPAHLEVSA